MRLLNVNMHRKGSFLGKITQNLQSLIRRTIVKDNQLVGRPNLAFQAVQLPGQPDRAVECCHRHGDSHLAINSH
jgi:hypothetical protein